MIIPKPGLLVRAPGAFTLGPATTVRASGGVLNAADLLRTLLAPATGLPLAPAASGTATDVVELSLTPSDRAVLGDEGYHLTVTPDAVRLRAARQAGLLHGIQTLRQLLPSEALLDHPVRGTAWRIPCLELTDVPRFGWRGAMLDVARHFQPLPFLLRTVDLLAFHKLNVLHLHLTDDQGWRMPSAAYPLLTEVGGRRARSMLGQAGSERFDDRPHGGSYTVGELRTLVRYAADRGVTVMPEIEMPGHTRAALAAYPHLGNVPGRRLDVWTEWGVCDTILGVHEEVFDFCRTVLDEVLEVFPSPYVHVGGDECPTTEWERSPAARRRAAELGLAAPAQLHGWFLGRIGRHLLERGRRPLAWAEGGDSALPPEFTVMAWRDGEHGLDAARRGHDVVMAPHRSTYLDYPQSDAPDEPLGQADAVVDLRAVHDNEPTPEHWTAAERARVLGTQAQLWSEFVVTPEQADYLTFPRLCALADRAWNPSSDWTTDFLPALRDHGPRLHALGINRTTRSSVPQ